MLGNSTPRETYTSNLGARRASLAAAVQRHNTLGNLRIAIVIVAAAAGYASYGRALISAWWLLAPFAAFIWTGIRLDRARTITERSERSVALYERALARLDGRWADTGGETGERFSDDEHLYARDLDLFGEASLFELLSAARTRIGEETLASWLKNRAEPATVRERQQAVIELAPRVDVREDFAVLGEDARTGVHTEALAAWGERPPRLDSPTVPVWAWPLSAAGALAAVGMIVWLAVTFKILAVSEDTMAVVRAYVMTMFAVCGSVVWSFRKNTGAILAEVGEAGHDLGLLAGVIGRIEREQFRAARLASLGHEFDAEGHKASHRISKLDALVHLNNSREDVFIRLTGPLLLWDLHLSYAVERWRRASGPAVRGWLTAVGEIEALSSLAGYSYEHPDDAFPEFAEGAPAFDAESLGHPFLSEALTVRNDVHLAGELRVMIVSGSNMSGKTTLLRTVGVNAVLAQAGAPVRARRLRMTPLEIGASIRNQDSLQAGVSRFFAEISRIGRIMQRAVDRPPVLFLIDELLSGTNSHDRRIGAEAVVRGLVERGAIGLVTTHDLALTEVVNAMSASGANVHFEDSIDDGRMRFDYRMRPGVVEKSNALELMRSVGLDV